MTIFKCEKLIKHYIYCGFYLCDYTQHYFDRGEFCYYSKSLMEIYAFGLKKSLGNQSCTVSINLTIHFSINPKHPFITYGNFSSW